MRFSYLVQHHHSTPGFSLLVVHETAPISVKLPFRLSQWQIRQVQLARIDRVKISRQSCVRLEFEQEAGSRVARFNVMEVCRASLGLFSKIAWYWPICPAVSQYLPFVLKRPGLGVVQTPLVTVLELFSLLLVGCHRLLQLPADKVATLELFDQAFWRNRLGRSKSPSVCSRTPKPIPFFMHI